MRDFAAKSVRITQQKKVPEIEPGRGGWRSQAIRFQSPQRWAGSKEV
jgi:hypothetical protein